MAVEFLDEHYLGLTALVTIGIQLLCFIIAATCKFDLITDFAGSMNYVINAWLTISLADRFFERQVLMTGMLTMSRLELAGFLLYRVCKRKKDARFDEVRENCCVFFVFWVFQMVWVWCVALPVVFVNGDASDPDWTGWDIAGVAMFVVGFLLQVCADTQKMRFRQDPANRGRVCDTGVWSWSRHPNYFGEILLWTGVFVVGIPVYNASESSLGWLSVLSPGFTVLILLFGSGIPTAEGKNLARYFKTPENAAVYTHYRENTSPLVPLPPCIYRNLPSAAQWLCCCEYGLYKYSPPKNKKMDSKLLATSSMKQ